MNKWYVAFTDADAEDVYEQYQSDTEAVQMLLAWANSAGEKIWEIYECADDECLTPIRLVWR